MKRVLPILFIGSLGASPAAAQSTDLMAQMAANPVSQTTRMMLEQHSRNMVAAAELMPADKYSFHPTEAQMTFGKLIAHIAQTNEFICSAIAGSPKPSPPTTPTEADSKDVLVNAVKESFDRCSATLANLTDAQATEQVAMGTQKVPRVYFMFVIVADWADHYSTEASYLRLNGILPPSARPAAARQ
jgi:uncharacterized damage-inducible protein DinB